MKMKLGLVSSTLLYLAACTSNVYSTHGPPKICCRMTKTKVRLDSIVDYQTSTRCHVIVFTTKLGKSICADPRGSWTRRAIGKVNADRQTTDAALQVVRNAPGEAIFVRAPRPVTVSGGAQTLQRKRQAKEEKGKQAEEM